jgi:hypothetical protein
MLFWAQSVIAEKINPQEFRIYRQNLPFADMCFALQVADLGC